MTDITTQTTNAAVRHLVEQREWCALMLRANPPPILADDYQREMAEIDAALTALAAKRAFA